MSDYRTDGGQISYEALLTSKENLELEGNLDVSQSTVENAYKRRIRKAREEQLESLLQLAGLGGGIYGTALLVNKNPELASFIAKLPGANRYAEKHKLALKTTPPSHTPTNVSNLYSTQSFGRSVLSIINSIEELSPFGILKTLQTSNILEPFVKISRDSKDINIKGSTLQASMDYYDALVHKASGGKESLTGNDLTKGLVLRNNKLLRYDSNGVLDEKNPVLNYVRAVTTHTKMGENTSPNRVLNKFAALLGTDLGANSYEKESIALIAGKSWAGLARDWANATIVQGMEIGYKTMDNPIAGAEDLFRAGGFGATGIFENKTYNKIKSLVNIQLGTQGDYNSSTPKALQKFTTNLATKSIGLYVGYQAINHVLDMVTPDSSVWSDGLVSGLTANYANVRVGLAKVLADPFQRYKEAQENAADGSTSLITLLGFPLAGATLGASLPYYKRMFDSATKGIEKASDIADQKTHGYGFAEGFAKKLKLTDTTASKSLGFKGALLGAAITLPFLPGALIGDSSEELKQSYSGEKLEAYRSNANWLAGGTAWEGGSIKGFVPSRVARILSGAKDEVLYDGDNDLKRDLDPIYSPFKFLKNPYAFEERHTDDMPYPVWGMNVSYGSFVGKAFQGTIGEIIKPTVINENFVRDSRILRTNALEEYRRLSQVDIDPNSSGESYDISKISVLSKILKNNPDGYAITFSAKKDERQLIDSGLMLAEESPYSDPGSISLSQTYNALTDFTGLKGFLTTLGVSSLGFNPEEVRRQLARSGDATSLSDTIQEENLGDIGGLGEIQRRLIPTSAGSRVDDVNPMLNTVAPDWLPNNEEKYYLDFKKGNYWDKVSLGEHRLAGKGYEQYNPEVKGLDPNDYPLVHQYKILSDVAMGSPEQIAMREYLLKASNENKLSERETDIFYTTLTQEQAKARKKQFSEYKTDEEYSNLSLGGKVLNTIWETAAHNVESPLEPLTPFRPGAKFVHKRTAIEDYRSTMLNGPDTAIWTNPFAHFIKPAINRSLDAILPGVQRPKEAEERDNVEEYFDKLEYLKARMNGRPNDALRTVHGATASGILDQSAFNKFRSGLSDKQRDYLEAFAQKTDKKEQKEILEMLPTDVAKGYKRIWENLEVAQKAKDSGSDINKSVENHYLRESLKYLQQAGFKDDTFSKDIDEAVSNARKQKAMEGKGEFSKKDELLAKATELRLRQADREAISYISNKTGVPQQDWIGWDPRLKLDEVKLRMLKIGKADTYDYGFWDSDLQRNSRIIALDDEDDITRSFEDIKRTMRSDIIRKNNVERSLFNNGIFARRVTLTDANTENMEVRINE